MKIKFKLADEKERLFVWMLIVVFFTTFIIVSVIIFGNYEDQIKLEMKFSSEKSFNSVYMALNDSSDQAEIVMEKEGVTGIGIYSSNGAVYQRLGDAPEHLNFSKIISSDKDHNDSTLGIYHYNDSDNTIEYYRLSRFGVMLGTGTMRFTQEGRIMPLAFEIPEIVYVKFDGSDFFNALSHARLLFGLCIGVSFILILMVANFYEVNRRFRIAFAKNESLAKLGAAARTLTHEIKNPLSVLTIQTALLKKTLPEQYSNDLVVLDQEINRLTNLTNKVSDFLKNPLGNPVIINLIPYIKNIIKLFPYDIAFICNEESDVFISFDLDRARSVFENLIKNATESSSSGVPEIEVEIVRKRKNVSVFVKDRGDGLREDAKKKLFSPFYTTKTNGSGIGLSISSQFVNAHSGSLKLSNRDGGGTVAQVTLPCVEVSDNESTYS